MGALSFGGIYPASGPLEEFHEKALGFDDVLGSRGAVLEPGRFVQSSVCLSASKQAREDSSPMSLRACCRKGRSAAFRRDARLRFEAAREERLDRSSSGVVQEARSRAGELRVTDDRLTRLSQADPPTETISSSPDRRRRAACCRALRIPRPTPCRP